MEKIITWNKGFFSSTYRLFSNGMDFGFLKISAWSNKAIGEINEKRFEFKTKGFIKQETIITDLVSCNDVGIIVYSKWKSNAVLKISYGEELNF